MLTQRQVNLLEAIINEYISNAEPVGSTLIVQKYELECSPATVRNEMARLLDEGYLEMLHSSSGRVPTQNAYKFFLEELMEEEDMDVLQEVAIKQKLWANRYAFEKLLRKAAHVLSETTNELAFAVNFQDEYLTFKGAVNILDYKEFHDIDLARSTLQLFDNFTLVQPILNKVNPNKELTYLIGSEIGKEFEECSMLIARYDTNKKAGYVGVFGPARMNYQKIIPTLRYVREMIVELGSNS